MKFSRLSLVACVFWLAFESEAETTRLRLSSIVPGTEKVQLVQNGDFQFQGTELTNSHPNPTGWSRQAEMFVGPGTNVVLLNGGAVAFAQVSVTSPSAGLYTRAVQLEPNTGYVLSAYLWNFGNAANRVTTVIDFSDVFNEPQMTLEEPTQTPTKATSSIAASIPPTPVRTSRSAFSTTA